MPSNERFRLHDGQESTPVDEARQRNERNSGRVISSPRLDLPLEVQRQLLAQEQILGGELCMWPQGRRHESQDVASDAHDRAQVEARTAVGHAEGCYRCGRLVLIDRRHEDTLYDPCSAAPTGFRQFGQISLGIYFLRTTAPCAATMG